MKNPLSKKSKARGLIDSTFHSSEAHQHNNQQNVALPAPSAQRISLPTATPMSTSPPSLVSSLSSDHGFSHNSHAPTTEPSTAYPYAAHQADQTQAQAVWEFNVSNNTNKRGQQRGGNIRVGNSSNGAPLPFTLPQNGRFVFNASNNVNEDGHQENGNIEFANVDP